MRRPSGGGLVDGTIMGPLFHRALRRSEVAARRWPTSTSATARMSSSCSTTRRRTPPTTEPTVPPPRRRLRWPRGAEDLARPPRRSRRRAHYPWGLHACPASSLPVLADAVVETHDRTVGRTYREAARTWRGGGWPADPAGSAQQPQQGNGASNRRGHLNQHRPVDVRPELVGGATDLDAQLLRRDVVTVLGGLADGIRQRIGLGAFDTSLGQLPGNGQRIKHRAFQSTR